MRKIAGLMVAFAILVFGVNLVLRRHGGEAPTAAVQAATPKPALAPGAICVADAPRHFKDPDSVTISTVNGPITLEQYKGAIFEVVINAKNSSGGYVGNTAYLCQLAPDGSRVLNFWESTVDGRGWPESDTR